MSNDNEPREHAETAAEIASAQQADRAGRVVVHSLSGVLCAFVVITLLTNAAVALFIVPKFIKTFRASCVFNGSIHTP